MITDKNSFGPAEALTILLTVEGLLLAALSISSALAGETKSGRQLVSSAFRFGLLTAMVISAVALGAASAWSQLFEGRLSDGWAFLPSLALAIGIVAQPLFALWIALSLRGS